MGSKRRIAKYIVPIMVNEMEQNNVSTFIDAFGGGANLIEFVPNKYKRIYNEKNTYIVEFFKKLVSGWIPPSNFSEQDYYNVRDNKDKYPPELVAFAGISCSYGAKWFGGWSRGKDSKGNDRNYVDESIRHLTKQKEYLLDVEFLNYDYKDLEIKEKSLIYCDIPYKDTTKYKDSFNYEEFYEWCRDMKSKGHIIYVSEYAMPNDFKEVWSKEINSSLTKETGSKKGIEKLFKL